MTNLLKRLFGGEKQPAQATPDPTPAPAPKPENPPIPQEEIDKFTSWFCAQTRPAIAFQTAPYREVTELGCKLGGPAWLEDGEQWPKSGNGVPLEFIFQLDLADCSALEDYPADTILQFFVARDDLFGANFEELVTGDFLVHARQPDDMGSLHAPPPLKEVAGELGSDYSPFMEMDVRNKGLMLDAIPVTDTIDFSIDGVYDRIWKLSETYDITQLENWIEADGATRPLRHHTGGYPAFTQSDITATPAGKPFDHVLLRLTSDDTIMWGDSGECVFLIRSEDLRNNDFSRVAYSWDCY